MQDDKIKMMAAPTDDQTTEAPCVQRELPCYDFSLDNVSAVKLSPVEMRKCLVGADEFRKAGILFVVMPVLNKKDGDQLCNEAFARLNLLERKASL